MLFRVVVITVCLSFSIGSQLWATNHQEWQEDELVNLWIEGPSQAIVVVAANYESTLVDVDETTVQRIELQQGKAVVPMNQGVGAFRVAVYIPGHRDEQEGPYEWRASLRNSQGEVIERRSVTIPGWVQFDYVPQTSLEVTDSTGEPPPIQLTVPRTSLSESERAQLTDFHNLVSGEGAEKLQTPFGENAEPKGGGLSENEQQLVSQLPISKLDAAIVGAWRSYCRTKYGKLQSPQPQDWIRWEGERDSLVFHGPLIFESASVWITIVWLNGQLVDLEVAAEEEAFPTWLNELTDEEFFQDQARDFVVACFARRSLDAWRLIAPRYRAKYPVSKLATLASQLRRDFSALGEKSASKVLMREFQVDSRRLSVFQNWSTTSGKEIVVRLEYFIPCRGDTIRRAELAEFQVSEAWGSRDPKTLEIAQTLSQELLRHSGGVRFANTFKKHAHPELALLLSESRLMGMGQTVAKLFENEPFEWQFASCSGKAGNTIASGWISASQKPSDATFWKMEFADGQIIAMDVIAESLAYSTQNCIEDRLGIQEKAAEFWRALFDGRVLQAHQKLATKFQLKFSAVALQNLVDEALGGLELVELKPLDFRNWTGAQRVNPVSVSCYHLATFKNGTELPLRTLFEMRTVKDSADSASIKADLVTFNTDFRDVFISKLDTEARTFLRRLEAGSIADMFDDATPRFVENLDPAVVAGVSRWLFEADDKALRVDFSRVRVRRSFDGLGWVDRLETSLGEKASLVARFRNGALDNLDIKTVDDQSAMPLAKFVAVENVKPIGSEFIKLWFNQRIDDTAKIVIPELRINSTRQRLTELATQLLVDNGLYVDQELIDVRTQENGSTLTQRWRVEFTDGKVELMIAIEFSRLRPLIKKIDVLKPK